MSNLKIEILKAKAEVNNLCFCVEQNYNTDIFASLLNLKDVLNTIDDIYEEEIEDASR